MKKSAVILIIAALVGIMAQSHAQVAVGVSVGIAPPAIPVYAQPPCPVEGYFWTPGYWAWDPDAGDYYWVPGVWLAPPTIGFLWTPGYWGFYGGHYLWHGGYWGPHIGFYGGINYGFGYYGHGFYGGRWEGGHFMYNSAAWHVGGGFHNTYADRGFHDPGGHSGFNGVGGVVAEPNHDEEAAMHEQHTNPTAAQNSHESAMSRISSQRASVNHGSPRVSAMSSVHGQRYNSGGHALASSHHTTARPANGSHSATQHSGGAQQQPRQQAQRQAPSHQAPAMHQQPRQQAPPQHGGAPMHGGGAPMHSGGGGMHGGGGGGMHGGGGGEHHSGR